MVYVRLAQDWTDAGGTSHSAGDMVDVDAGTLAELEAAGVVASPDGGGDDDAWPGPTATSGGKTKAQAWPGPTGGDGDSWPGPT